MSLFSWRPRLLWKEVKRIDQISGMCFETRVRPVTGEREVYAHRDREWIPESEVNEYDKVMLDRSVAWGGTIEELLRIRNNS